MAPEGDATRPTTDRLRESLASMLASQRGLSFDGASVLDAFAGSGACSLELLSRGAAHATLVEANGKAQRTIRRNLAELGAGDAATLVAGDAFRVAEREGVAGSPFSIVILDPPYATEAQKLLQLVMGLAEGGHLAPGALVVHERSAQAEGLPESELLAAGFALAKSRRISQSALDIWRYDGATI